MKGAYWFKFLIALDVFACAILLRDGDTTISSECGLALRNPSGNRALRALGRVLNTISHNHCEQAISGDISRANAAIARLKGP